MSESRYTTNSEDYQDPMGLDKINAEDLTNAQKSLKVVRLTLAGWSAALIGNALGISARHVFRILAREVSRLERLSLETTEKKRRLEVERCNEMIRALWPQVMKGHPRSIEVALRVSERRCRLEGLDAPLKTELTIDVSLASATPAELVAEAERLGLPFTNLSALPSNLPGEKIADAEFTLLENKACDTSPASSAPSPIPNSVSTAATPSKPAPAADTSSPLVP